MKVGIVTSLPCFDYNMGEIQVCYSTLLDNRDYKRGCQLSKKYLIMDSSPILPIRNQMVDSYITSLSRGLEELRVDAVICPGVSFSSKETVRHTRYFINSSRKLPTTIMQLQGYDLASLRECYKELVGITDIVGLPSTLEKIAKREEIVRDLGIEKPILYMEVYSNPYEELPPKSSFGVYTSFPVRLAYDLRILEEYRPTPPVLPLLDTKKTLVEDLVKENIESYISLVKGGRNE